MKLEFCDKTQIRPRTFSIENGPYTYDHHRKAFVIHQLISIFSSFNTALCTIAFNSLLLLTSCRCSDARRADTCHHPFRNLLGRTAPALAAALHFFLSRTAHMRLWPIAFSQVTVCRRIHGPRLFCIVLFSAPPPRATVFPQPTHSPSPAPRGVPINASIHKISIESPEPSPTDRAEKRRALCASLHL